VDGDGPRRATAGRSQGTLRGKSGDRSAPKLATGAVREMAGDAKVGRAEAMRRSMLALIDKGSKEEAHPAFWAPFVVVGEGAAGRQNGAAASTLPHTLRGSPAARW
jgi:hypothetical protein